MDNNDSWRKKLNPEQYRILREKGTEVPFSGKYVNEKAKGMYTCVACGNELFFSGTKFDSGTGWPSFTDPANKKNIILQEDTSGGPPSPDGYGRASMSRVEVVCKNCGGHLGHVFGDGPNGKQRYCINSACLNLEKEEAAAVEVSIEAPEAEKEEDKDGQKNPKSNSAGNILSMLGMAAVGMIMGGGFMSAMSQVTDLSPLSSLVCAVTPQVTAPRPLIPVIPPRATTSVPTAGAPAANSSSQAGTPAPAGDSADGTQP